MIKRNHTKNNHLTPSSRIFVPLQTHSVFQRQILVSAAPVCPGEGARQSFLPLCYHTAAHLNTNSRVAEQNFMNHSKGMFTNTR